FLAHPQKHILSAPIRKHCGNGPYVTGAYTINTRSAGVGLTKLAGVIKCIQIWLKQHRDWRDMAYRMRDERWTLAQARDYLRGPCLAGFMTGQILADLKFTSLLRDAPDWWTYALSGPGSRAGLNLMLGRPVDKSWREDDFHARLLELQAITAPFFAAAEMPPVCAMNLQNILCEYAKFTRGYTRGRFNGV